jgi:hypothetical protein
VQLKLPPVSSPRRQRGVQRPAGVNYQQVARSQVLFQVSEAGMFDGAITQVLHHQAHFIPAEAACFRRLSRFKFSRQFEFEPHLIGLARQKPTCRGLDNIRAADTHP